MKSATVLLACLCVTAPEVTSAQSARDVSFGVWGGATIYAAVAGTGGIQVSKGISQRLSGGLRASVLEFVGPCSDPDPVLRPYMCLADGRLIGAFASFRTESVRRTTEPYIEAGVGAYNFIGEYKRGSWSPYVEAGLGLQISVFQLGVRYMRVIDAEAQADLFEPVSYLSPIIGFNF